MECLTPSFSGGSEGGRIAWRFDSSGMREGDERSGRFVILSDCGEYELPFHVKIQGGERFPAISDRGTQSGENGREGELSGLFPFVRLARESWKEAEKLFYSSGGSSCLSGSDRKYRSLYKGLSRSPGNGQNMEEFLVSAGKKPPWNIFSGEGAGGKRFRFQAERSAAVRDVCGEAERLGLYQAERGGGRRVSFSGKKGADGRGFSGKSVQHPRFCKPPQAARREKFRQTPFSDFLRNPADTRRTGNGLSGGDGGRNHGKALHFPGGRKAQRMEADDGGAGKAATRSFG